jgi:hypothetical protein
MMKSARGAWLGVTVAALAMLGSQSSLAAGDRGDRSMKASLTGFEEPPAVSSTGRGEFEMTINREDESIDYTLSFRNLEGVVTQSHVHVGQLSINGGISFWLCQTATNPAPAASGMVPTCPAGPDGGTVTGTVTKAQILGPAGQFFVPGEPTLFAEVVRAVRAGVTYANVHSSRNPGGEIRGQIRMNDGDDRGQDDHDR